MKRCTYKDNGIGFEIKQWKSKGLGMKNIESSFF
jgi:signal transduction histidine kinase